MRVAPMIFACALCMAVAASAGAATYTANFDSGDEGWTGDDGPIWNATGGEDGGFYSGKRNDKGGGPYLVPPADSILYGDVAGNFGNVPISFSYYLKDISGGALGMGMYMFADADASGGWDTLWLWTPDDISAPTDWTNYSFVVDPSSSTPSEGWVNANGGPGSWTESWQNVWYWNFWTAPPNGTVQEHGIDTVLIQSVPEPSTIVLLMGVALMALLRRRK